MRGASALESLLEEQHDPRIRVFVVWEPVLPTDFAAPSTMTLKRLADLRVSQYWDKDHLVSKSLGERDSSSAVWDYVAVYQTEKLWDLAPPEPVYSNVPVVKAIEGTRGAIWKLLNGSAN